MKYREIPKHFDIGVAISAGSKRQKIWQGHGWFTLLLQGVT